MSETTEWLDIAYEKWVECQTAARLASFRAGEATAYANLAEANAQEARAECNRITEKSKLWSNLKN